MRTIDGRAIASAIAAQVTAQAAALRDRGVVPTLAVVVATDDEATLWYVRSIQKASERVGVACRIETVAEPTAEALARRLGGLSADPGVHGIICQTPLPHGIRLDDLAPHIDPAKDIDGATPMSLGRLAVGAQTFPPATAAAVLEILDHESVPLAGARAVVVGRSTVVGKPVALLLLARDATVTICHSKTPDLAGTCREADVLVVAAGRAHLVDAGYVKAGAIVVDVGTNPMADGTLVGDVDPAGLEHASALTPVPGGVGPVTTMVLMRHVVTAASR